MRPRNPGTLRTYRGPPGLLPRVLRKTEKSLTHLQIIMNVGICKVKLRLPENLSLKGKRQVVKSITAKLSNKFNVSVAEVDDNDLWQLATVGICCISNDQRFSNEILSKAVEFIKNSRFDVELIDYEIEIIAV
jgi:uncharacterized protein